MKFSSGKKILHHIPIFLCLLVTGVTQAQKGVPTHVVDSILTLPIADRQWALWLAAYPPKSLDTTAEVNHFLLLEREFKSRGQEALAQQAWLMRVQFMAVYIGVYSPNGLTVIDHAVEEAHSRGWKMMEAGCTVLKGYIYYQQNKFGPAFEFLQQGYHHLQLLGLDQCPNINQYLDILGQCYYEFGDYEGAIRILREGAALDSDIMARHGDLRKLKNTLALAYQKLERYDSAAYFFQQAHDESMRNGYTFWAALTNGNLGYLYYLSGDFDKAIPLMEVDFHESQAAAEWNSAVNAAMILSTMYLKKGQLTEATTYLEFAKKNINYGNVRDLSGFYKNLAYISKLKGDFEHAFAYADSSALYSDSLRKINNTRVLNQARLKAEVDQHAHEIQLLEAKRSRQLLIRNSLVAILLLTGIIAALWVNRQRLKRQKELDRAAFQKSRAEDELKNAQNELQFFTHALKEKNELIEQIRSELEQLHHDGEETRTEQLNQLLNASILTEEDWKAFRILFDKVYPGFFIRLKEKMPDLSPADTRLLALTKLQLAPKEMAAMLGITYDAIKKSRQRLRRKIDLPEDGSLDEVVETI